MLLDQTERNFHRFLVEDADAPECPLVCRMKRLTFGVTLSPFLASAVLRKAADDHKSDYPVAAKVIHNQFYVDNVLTGASTPDEAMYLRQELNDLLQKAGMTLRKWRVTDPKVHATIPADLQENNELYISSDMQLGNKALGLHWNCSSDQKHVVVPSIQTDQVPTKRLVASSAARVYDILGWFSLAVATIKILLQRVWETGGSWDDPIPEPMQKAWREELGPAISSDKEHTKILTKPL